MKILFRLNVGKSYGYGHLSRDLALGATFKRQGIGLHFLMKTDDIKSVEQFIKSNGYSDISFSCISHETSKEEDIKQVIEHYKNGFSFLVLDLYNLNINLQKHLKKEGVKWAQFDYKATGKILADIVINANISVKPSDYENFVEKNTKLCLGSKYAIIREDLLNIKVKPEKNRILIAMGCGEYSKDVIEIIKLIVVDKLFKFEMLTKDNRLISLLKSRDNINIRNNFSNIAEIYSKCEAAIVAGGVTTFEMAYLGIPMIIIPYTDNQVPNKKAWDDNNYGVGISGADEFKNKIKKKGLRKIISDIKRKVKYRILNINGLGAERISREILEKINPDDY
jgi:UDP-2,4-diacetamido-2,4,6-trideoxy-beta-L-altropyranose hydrolase